MLSHACYCRARKHFVHDSLPLPVPNSTLYWMQQSSANYSCYTRNAAMWMWMCMWMSNRLGMARMEFGSSMMVVAIAAAAQKKKETWEKPIEIVSSLLQLPMAMGMDCVCPASVGSTKWVSLQTSLGNYWSCACLCACVCVGPHLRNECIWPLWEFKTEFWPICEISLCPRGALRFCQLD